MIVTPVKTQTEALAVALIRNECRQWMTHNSKELTVGAQLSFFANMPSGLRLFAVFKGRTPIGYAVIRTEKEKAWLTGGLAEPFRGNGFGKQLFARLLELCAMAKKRPWLSVLRSNSRAIHLYQSLGFTTVRTTKRLLVMKHDTAA